MAAPASRTRGTRALRIIQSEDQVERAPLVSPGTSGYILLLAEVDRRPPWLPASRNKRSVLTSAKEHSRALLRNPLVRGATVFRAALIPPGRGALLERRPFVHTAHFDVVVLIEVNAIDSLARVEADEAFRALEGELRGRSRLMHEVRAFNARSMGPVDHSRKGVFLFNYFYADDREQNLAVWEYTAGWFHRETGLDNSTLLVPLDPAQVDYTVINHCRWDHYHDVLPSLLLKRSFRRFVLASFEANDTAAMPILYRLA